MRLLELIQTASGHLEGRGFENARLEVERLIGKVLDKSRMELYLSFDRPVSDEERDEFRALYRRRLKHEPLQHILGKTEFREVQLKTDNRALIPRPETEVLVEIAIRYLRENNVENARVADIGTGSGAIALSIVYEVHDAHTVGVDISEQALALARRNAYQLGLENRSDFLCGNLFEPLNKENELFDAVLSNPPYIRSAQIASLDPEVSRYDPRLALDGGDNGLMYLEKVIYGAREFLKTSGLLAVECGFDQAVDVEELMRDTGAYEDIKIIRDLAGHDRVVRAVRS
jgi:release factor glutamine methyltransferase